jgi:hypothetical protein
MTKTFTPGVYPDNVPDCHAMLRLVEAMLGHEQARLAAVELLSEPTFKAADEITRLNAEVGQKTQLVHDMSNMRESAVAKLASAQALIDELVEGLEGIANERVFNQQRFAEDTDTDYFLRCFRAVKDHARALILKVRSVKDGGDVR